MYSANNKFTTFPLASFHSCSSLVVFYYDVFVFYYKFIFDLYHLFFNLFYKLNFLCAPQEYQFQLRCMESFRNLTQKTNSEDTFLIQKINRMGLSSTSHHSLQFYSLSYVWIWELPLALDLQPARSVFFSGNFKKNSKLVAKCKERPPRFVKKKFS